MAQTQIAIRRWTAAERLDDILAMVHAAFGAFEPPSGVLKETTADLMKRQRDGFVLVAQESDAFVGSVFCARNGDALYLTRLAVAPSRQRRGIGRALMAAAEEEARRLGARRLTLRVRKNLPANRSYFEGFGFTVSGEGRDPGRPPYYAMERVLQGPSC